MLNLKKEKYELLKELELWNVKCSNSGEMGVCLEVNEDGKIGALDDEDWSTFMSEGGYSFIVNNKEYYFYKSENDVIMIPILFVKKDDEDVCDAYLDVENSEIIKSINMFNLEKLDVDQINVSAQASFFRRGDSAPFCVRRDAESL